GSLADDGATIAQAENGQRGWGYVSSIALDPCVTYLQVRGRARRYSGETALFVDGEVLGTNSARKFNLDIKRATSGKGQHAGNLGVELLVTARPQDAKYAGIAELESIRVCGLPDLLIFSADFLLQPSATPSGELGRARQDAAIKIQEFGYL